MPLRHAGALGVSTDQAVVTPAARHGDDAVPGQRALPTPDRPAQLRFAPWYCVVARSDVGARV